MKKFIWFSLSLVLFSGCATTSEPPEMRIPMYTVDNYSELVNKNISVLSIIDARPDMKPADDKMFQNWNLFDEYVIRPLKYQGYKPNYIKVDTSTCGSLLNIRNINEITCLDKSVFKNGDLFLILSIDRYDRPKSIWGMGTAYVTGIIYSKSSDSIIWKYSGDGQYFDPGTVGAPSPLGFAIVNKADPREMFFVNVYSMIEVLERSIPEVK